MENFSTFTLDSIQSGFKGVLELPLFPVVGRELKIPVMVARGHRPGPVFLVVAGVHGDEFEGMEAICRVYEALEPDRMSGMFVGIPVCNMLAYENQTRESPVYADGLNLARTFPGSPEGSYTVRLAHELYQFVVRNLNPETDVFLDFHSGGTRYEYLPMIAFHKVAKKRQEAEKLARIFGIERIWEIPINQGTFNGSISEYGITTLGTETTGRGAAKEEDIQEYFQGVLNVLHHIGIFETAAPKDNSGPVFTSQRFNFLQSGFFQSFVHNGEQVEKGQLIGKVSTLTGTILEEIYAPLSGEIWAIRTYSAVYTGDISFLIARPL
jgi:predicted deacylase